MRMLFLAIFLESLLSCAWLGLVMAAVGSQLSGARYVALLVACCLAAATAVAAGLGMLRAQHHPMRWAKGLAAFSTLSVVLPPLTGQLPGILDIIIALSSWGALMAIQRFDRLAKDNPGFAELQNLAQAQDPRQAARTRANVRAIGKDFRTAALLGAGVIVLVCGAVIVRNTFLSNTSSTTDATPATPIDAVLARFEQAWRNSDPKAIEPLFVPRLQSKASTIGRTLMRRGFESPYPALRDRRLGGETGTHQTVNYTTDVCDLKVVFEWVDGAWGISNFIFS